MKTEEIVLAFAVGAGLVLLGRAANARRRPPARGWSLNADCTVATLADADIAQGQMEVFVHDEELPAATGPGDVLQRIRAYFEGLPKCKGRAPDRIVSGPDNIDMSLEEWAQRVWQEFGPTLDAGPDSTPHVPIDAFFGEAFATGGYE